MAEKNRYKVSKKKWRKWSEAAHAVFNDLYANVLYNQDVFSHPSAVQQKGKHWKTTAWNVAWWAADSVDHKNA